MGEINTSKLFIDLFNIYEEELLSIFQYVAPISQNINGNISGNRIHELHIRICSEVENLAKTILEKYEYISHDITNNMVSCLKILNKHFNTCNKKIYFCQSMNFDEDKQLYQPLQQENKKK